MADAPIVSQSTAHPIWTVIVIGVAFGVLVLLDAIVASLTDRGLYDRLRDLVAKIVSPLQRTPASAAVPAGGMTP